MMADQEKTDAAAQAAGEAAYDQAQKSNWPPTEEDIEAIGAVAGTAAGTILCIEAGPAAVACGAIGGLIGGVVGNVLYNVVDNLFTSAQEGEFAEGMRNLERILATKEEARAFIIQVRKECNLGQYYQAAAKLREWGAPLDSQDRVPENLLRAWVGYLEDDNLSALNAGIAKWEKTMFASTSAAIADCKTREKVSGSNSSGKALLLAGGAVAALWALTRIL